MQALVNFLEVKVSPIANKLGSQRHLASIRKGIVATLPLTIVGSFFTILLNIPIDSIAERIAPYASILDIPFRFTVGILALYATFGIAYALAENYKLDTLTSGLMAVLAFLITTVSPVRVLDGVDGVIGSGRYLNIASLSSASLFGAIVSAIVSVELFYFIKRKNWTLKMPKGVPPEVANSFMALIPTAIVILVFWTVKYVLGFDINSFLSGLLMPFKDFLAGNSFFGGLFTVILICIFWVLGIHGPAILGPVIRPFWDISIAENMDSFASGVDANLLPNIFTEQFLQWFVWIGGSGASLALVVLFMRSKSTYLKRLGRLSFVPGLFNINEPIIFGAPIVMNPILAIPFILAPIVMTSLAYILTVSNVIPMMMARLPFTVIAPFAAWISTNWSVMAGILVVINFLIALAIYYPFFKVFERQQLENERNNLE